MNIYLALIISQILMFMYVTCDKRREILERRKMLAQIEDLKSWYDFSNQRLDKLEFNSTRIQNVFKTLKNGEE